MLARIHKSMEEREGGFTLIELLVVMIIIGILAAIAIPVFLSQRNKAKDTSAKADATTIGKDLASYFVDGTSTINVTGATAGGTWTSDVGGLSGKLSNGNTAVGKGVDDTNWCVKVTSATGNEWWYSSDAGLQSSQPATTSCPAAAAPAATATP